jgi:hypothetical protein
MAAAKADAEKSNRINEMREISVELVKTEPADRTGPNLGCGGGGCPVGQSIRVAAEG